MEEFEEPLASSRYVALPPPYQANGAERARRLKARRPTGSKAPRKPKADWRAKRKGLSVFLSLIHI